MDKFTMDVKDVAGVWSGFKWLMRNANGWWF